MPLPALSPEEQAALLEFAETHGCNWKTDLRTDWERSAAGPTLHRLRNTHGPSWLASLRLAELRPHETPFDAAAAALQDMGIYDGPWNTDPAQPS